MGVQTPSGPTGSGSGSGSGSNQSQAVVASAGTAAATSNSRRNVGRSTLSGVLTGAVTLGGRGSRIDGSSDRRRLNGRGMEAGPGGRCVGRQVFAVTRSLGMRRNTGTGSHWQLGELRGVSGADRLCLDSEAAASVERHTAKDAACRPGRTDTSPLLVETTKVRFAPNGARPVSRSPLRVSPDPPNT